MKLVLNETTTDIDALSNECGLSKEMTRYLALRGYDNREKIDKLIYFKPLNWRKVETLKDSKEFLETLRNALASKANICIYGDYDADGIMATMILYMALERISDTKVNWFINDRFKEGYGMNKKGVIRLLEKFPETNLILTCDNGIKAQEGIQYALEKGITVIVSDHHGQSVGEALPNCPVVCEARLDEDQDLKESFCGAELARRLMVQLYKDLGIYRKYTAEAKRWIAYSGLATITDSVPLNPANHYTAKAGIEMIGKEEDIVWRILREETKTHRLDQDTIGFQYGPMINAPGRINGNVDAAMEAFMAGYSGDEEGCRKAVKNMMAINLQRREDSAEDDQIAFQEIEEKGYDKDKFILIANERFLEGINGLTAGHITETFKVPSIVLCPKDQEPDVFKGSARSVEGFNIFEALNECKDLLLGFGGHPMAAGLSVHRDNIGALRERLKEMAENHVPEQEEVVKVDFIIQPENITPKLANELNTVMPYGQNLEKPTIGFSGKVTKITVMKDRHLRFDIDNGKGTPVEVLWWNAYERYKKFEGVGSNPLIKCIGFPSYSVFNGKLKIQFTAEEVYLQKGEIA